MTNNAMLANWIEFGLSYPGVIEDRYFPNQSTDNDRGTICDIYMLALVGKHQSLEEAQKVYEDTKDKPIPVQVEVIERTFSPNAHLWAYLLEISYFDAQRLLAWHGDDPDAKRLIECIRSGAF